MLFFISFLVVLMCDNFLQKSPEKLDLVSSFLFNSVVFFLAAQLVLQHRSHQPRGFYAGKAVFMCSLEICRLCPPISSSGVSWKTVSEFGVLLKLKIGYAPVPLQRVSMLLNYQKSLCPLLFPLYFSNFPLLCTFL